MITSTGYEVFYCECGEEHPVPNEISKEQFDEWFELRDLIPEGQRMSSYDIVYLDCPNAQGKEIKRGKTFRLMFNPPSENTVNLWHHLIKLMKGK